MKRFYCTTCQRVKRVQKWPTIIVCQDAASPKLREGVCDKHASPIKRMTRKTTSQPVARKRA